MTHGAGILQLFGFPLVFSHGPLPTMCWGDNPGEACSALKRNTGHGGETVAEASQPKPSPFHSAASPCLPLPRHRELPLKGFCAADTVGGNKLQAENVLSMNQSTMPAERHLPTPSCTTHFPKEPCRWREGSPRQQSSNCSRWEHPSVAGPSGLLRGAVLPTENPTVSRCQH